MRRSVAIGWNCEVGLSNGAIRTGVVGRLELVTLAAGQRDLCRLEGDAHMRRAAIHGGEIDGDAALVVIIPAALDEVSVFVFSGAISAQGAPLQNARCGVKWGAIRGTEKGTGARACQKRQRLCNEIKWMKENLRREIGAVERTRTSTGCPTATSTLRVYQFRHDRTW